MQKWQGFELLAEQIYAELNDRAQVKWNDHIVGYQSGVRRQIDVSIHWRDADRERLTVVQVKDWKKPADIVAVGEFSAVVRDVQADKGIMVCRAGFSKPTYGYARNIGLELHNLHDAQSKDWSRSLTVPILWQEQEPHFDMRIEARMDAGDTINSEHIGFVDLAGVQRDFQGLFVERWNSGELQRQAGVVHLYEPGGAVTLNVVRPDGTTGLRPTRRAEFAYEVKQTSWLGQFEPSVCRGYIDYLKDETFVVSYLPFGEVPTQRGEEWVRVDKPQRVAVSVAGSLVTSQRFGVEASSQTTSLLQARYLGP